MSKSTLEKIQSKLNSLETKIVLFDENHNIKDINRLRSFFKQYKKLKDSAAKESFVTSNNLLLEMCHAASVNYLKRNQMLRRKDQLILKLNEISTNEKTRKLNQTM